MLRSEIERRMGPALAASGSVSVSFVYPTRNRPAFVKEAIETLELQRGGDFQVIVSDNYTDRSLSCEPDIASTNLDLVYVRPPKYLPLMAQNWEYALQYATGEYVAFLTDKMFVLPNTVRRLEDAVQADRPEIVTWVTDNWFPNQYPYYFSDGSYGEGARGSGGPFSPAAELSRRGRTGRSATSPADYCRGKIVFGAYRRDLIDRCIGRFGGLFHRDDWGTTGLSPDYTSMILGLSEAKSALEMTDSCVVQLYTDLSAGALIDNYDVIAAEALDKSLWDALPIPGLYASQHNIVANDYVALKRKYDLPFDFDMDVWAGFCAADINRPSRVWSSDLVESQQKGILSRFMSERRNG